MSLKTKLRSVFIGDNRSFINLQKELAIERNQNYALLKINEQQCKEIEHLMEVVRELVSAERELTVPTIPPVFQAVPIHRRTPSQRRAELEKASREKARTHVNDNP